MRTVVLFSSTNQIKENHECSNIVANILPAEPPGSTGQNSTFSEHGHVAYQINGNHEMQQHGSKCFAGRPSPTTLGDGVKRSKFNFIRTWSCCISKGKVHEGVKSALSQKCAKMQYVFNGFCHREKANFYLASA